MASPDPHSQYRAAPSYILGKEGTSNIKFLSAASPSVERGILVISLIIATEYIPDVYVAEFRIPSMEDIPASPDASGMV